MTVSQLYSIYCAGYAELRSLPEGGPLRPPDVSLNLTGSSLLERVILELAIHDATNGTAMRSRSAFDRAVGQGAAMLRRLGMGDERDQTDRGGAAAPVLGRAA